MTKRKGVISGKDFTRDLSRGSLGEDLAEVFFEKEFGLIVENVSSNNPDYDMIVSGLAPEKKSGPAPSKQKFRRRLKELFDYTDKTTMTLEVKFDEAAARYKNFFLEVFFNVEDGSPGTIFKCKADLFVWIVPQRKRFKIYLLKRPEFMAWFFDYVFSSTKKIEYKTPGISPYARGIAVPIKKITESPACVGVFDYKM